MIARRVGRASRGILRRRWRNPRRCAARGRETCRSFDRGVRTSLRVERARARGAARGEREENFAGETTVVRAASSGDGAYVAERGFVLGKFRLVTEGDGEGLETARGSTGELVGEVVLGRALEGEGLMRERAGDTAGGTTRKGRRSGGPVGMSSRGTTTRGGTSASDFGSSTRSASSAYVEGLRGRFDARGGGCVLRGPPRTVDGCPSPRRAWTRDEPVVAPTATPRNAQTRVPMMMNAREGRYASERGFSVRRAVSSAFTSMASMSTVQHPGLHTNRENRGRRVAVADGSESVNARGRRARFERVTQTTVRGSMRVAM